MVTGTGAVALMKRRNRSAREYGALHAGRVADFAAFHYSTDASRETRLRLADAAVPLFTILERYRENAANEEWGELVASLCTRLTERNRRSSNRGLVHESGSVRPNDAFDPDDAETICNHLGRLPVPETEGLAILTRLVDSIPGAVVPNTRPDRTLPTRIAMVGGRAADVDARRAGGYGRGPATPGPPRACPR